MQDHSTTPVSDYPIDAVKTCNHCGETKLLRDFAKLASGAFGRQKRCRMCQRKMVRTTPSRKKTQSCRQYHLRTTYGMTVEEYDAMFAAQGGVCAICKTYPKQSKSGRNRNLSVDHCHATGKIRGLLCYHCNHILGNALENIERLRAAISYLEKYSDAPPPSQYAVVISASSGVPRSGPSWS